jgi:integrase
MWLFRVGTRISDSSRVRWDDLDLTRATVKLHVPKTDSHPEQPLHPEVVEAPAAIAPEECIGALFP